jgi:hypothetical protein
MLGRTVATKLVDRDRGSLTLRPTAVLMASLRSGRADGIAASLHQP